MKLAILICAVALPGFGASCSRYWVGGGSANTWAATGNTNWATSSGGANNASVPTTTDVVCFDGNSGTGNAVIGAGITIAELNCDGTDTGASGAYGGTITQNSGIQLGIRGSFVLSSSMTYTLNSGTSLLFSGTPSGSINTYGLTIPNTLIDSASTS